MGIPLTLLTLKSVGQLISYRITTVVATFERKILNRQEVKQVKTKSAVVLFSIMVFSLTVYSSLLMHSQNWTFVQGIYFCFVSFSTIGFGDLYISAYRQKPIRQLFVNSPTKNLNNVGKDALQGFRCILYALLAMFALCIVSSVLNSVMAAIEELKYFNYYCLVFFHRKIQDRSNSGQNNTTRHLDGNKPHSVMERSRLPEYITQSVKVSAHEIN